MGHLQELIGLYGIVGRELGINQLWVHVSDDGVFGNGHGGRIAGCRGWGQEVKIKRLRVPGVESELDVSALMHRLIIAPTEYKTMTTMNIGRIRRNSPTTVAIPMIIIGAATIQYAIPIVAQSPFFRPFNSPKVSGRGPW